MKCVISFKIARKFDESGTRIIESCNMVESMNISLMRIYERINDARKKLDIVGDVTINFVEEE
ncbi:MAG: hypothetical protein J6B82_05915 [Bacteroidaceae bacterium]|nr:hypothetical protein [Bacteroidaceae bacterium]